MQRRDPSPAPNSAVSTDSTKGTARRTQAERSATTRAAILGAARQLFGTDGYSRTGREDIAERAGVTRGALYHHFASKAEVFAEVVRALDDELAGRVMAAAQAAGSGTAAARVATAVRRGAHAYIDACAEADIARILIDAPSVLGLDTYRELSAASCRTLLAPALQAARDRGTELPGDPDVLAAMLLAALNEAALMVVTAPDPVRARAQVSDTVDAFLSRVVGP